MISKTLIIYTFCFCCLIFFFINLGEFVNELVGVFERCIKTKNG